VGRSEGRRVGVELDDGRVQFPTGLRHVGVPERARSDHDVPGVDRPFRRRRREAAALLDRPPRETVHSQAVDNRQLERPGVRLQIVGHLDPVGLRPLPPGKAMPGRALKRLGVNRVKLSHRRSQLSPTPRSSTTRTCRSPARVSQ